MASVAIALISAAVSIIVAALSYYFSKLKEREADWRKKKLEMYHQLFESISGIVEGNSTQEAQREFAKSCNVIGLVASAEVIQKLQAFQLASQPQNHGQHDKALTELLCAIRDDLGLPLSKQGGVVYKLWASGEKMPNN